MSLKDDYEATGQGEYVHQGSPKLRADNLAKTVEEAREARPEDLTDEAAAYREKSAVCHNLRNGDITEYLSQWEGEDTPEYEDRRKNSIYGFVDYYDDAVGGLVDQVYAKDLLTRFPEGMAQADQDTVTAFLDNVERRKRSPVTVSQFGRSACECSLGEGGTPLIVIDYPPLETDEDGKPRLATDKAEESERGAGPYFVLIEPWALIECKEDDDGNLVRVRYHSKAVEDAGEWGQSVTPSIVVLERGEPGGLSRRRVLKLDDAKKEYIEDPSETRFFEPPATASAAVRKNFREIPAVGLPTGDRSWFADPILLNVAMLNVLHYRKRTDYDVAESVSSVPQSAWFGFSNEELSAVQWGPFRRVSTSKTPQEADVKDISFGFETSQTSLKTLESIERYIQIKSREPQSQRATGEEKATIRLIDEAKKISRLQAWALGWLQSLQTALQWAGWWMGLEEVGELAYLDEVFETMDDSPGWSDFKDWMALALEAPSETLPLLIAEGKRYGVISDKHDGDELSDLIATAGPVGEGGAEGEGEGGEDES